MGINNKLNGEGRITGGASITIDDTSEWQHITTIAAGTLVNGLTMGLGVEKSITVFADGGGGQVTVTAAAHTIPEDHYVSITGTTNYNGLYQITNVATNTFEITETWAGDDATGTVRHGTHVSIAAGQGETTSTLQPSARRQGWRTIRSSLRFSTTTPWVKLRAASSRPIRMLAVALCSGSFTPSQMINYQ